MNRNYGLSIGTSTNSKNVIFSLVGKQTSLNSGMLKYLPWHFYYLVMQYHRRMRMTT